MASSFRMLRPVALSVFVLTLAGTAATTPATIPPWATTATATAWS